MIFLFSPNSILEVVKNALKLNNTLTRKRNKFFGGNRNLNLVFYLMFTLLSFKQDRFHKKIVYKENSVFYIILMVLNYF